ncbi:cytochrome b6f subunit family protein [Candidatus Cyanaurora vandensis]|uniref:cytochrome b6f subunit PetP n=1 Tax=Candidatus Cyanaurora vandensis TaxID=2714958 RepID=UPI00257D8D9B|nr:cytochrome b6f subunit family protein [Candidatus Cyanaurora vandensis]
MIQAGEKVRIRRIQDGLVGGRVAQKVGEVGIVRGQRIADGYGFGYVVEFQDGLRNWFFADEVEAI